MKQDQLKAAYYKTLTEEELFWFVKQTGQSEASTWKKAVSKARGLKWEQEKFDAFWTRDNIRNDPENPWNKVECKPSDTMKGLYARHGVQYVEKGDDDDDDADGEEDEQDEVEGEKGSSPEAEADKDAHGESKEDSEEESEEGLEEESEESSEEDSDSDPDEDPDEDPEEDEEPFDEDETELLETEDPYDQALAEAIANAADSSDSNNATSSAHSSSDDTPAQKDSSTMGPPEMPEYTLVKKQLHDLMAQVAVEGEAKVLSDLQRLNQESTGT